MPCLETKSLLLRPLTLCDTRKVFQMSQEQAMKKWLPRQVYGDEAHASSVIAFLAAQYRADIDPRMSPYVLGIELKSTQALVGHVGLSPLHGEVEVGFAVERSQQRKGIAPEAVLAMCEWFAKAWSKRLRSSSTRPEVEIVAHGRAGVVRFREGSNVGTFDWEFGGRAGSAFWTRSRASGPLRSAGAFGAGSARR